ncbi:MAG: glycosyltransferase 87 family protein [Stellaceae bacterium]
MSRRRLPALLGCAAALFGLVLLGLARQRRDDIDGFVIVAMAQGVVYLLSVGLVWNAGRSRGALTMILAVAALLRLPVLVAPPYLSTDIYRYVWDGRVEAAGINPYRYIPLDPHLEKLRDPRIFPRINRNNYAPTIYPPAAEAVFFLVTRISESLIAMKAAMVVCEAVTILLLLRLLGAAGLPSQRILVYAWHPLPIWEFAGSGHIDAAMIAFVVLALWGYRRGNRWLAGLALAGATLVKLYPALLLPALYRRWDWRMPVAWADAVILAYLPFVGVGWRVLGFLPGYAHEEGFTASGAGFFPWSLLQTLPAFAALPALAYLAGAAAILAVLALVVTFARKADDHEFAGAALLAAAFMFLLSPHYPWYFTWLIVFACFAPLLSLLWLTNASLLLYLVPVGSHLVRSDHRLLVEFAIYGPFVALALLDLWRRRQPAARRK